MVVFSFKLSESVGSWHACVRFVRHGVCHISRVPSLMDCGMARSAFVALSLLFSSLLALYFERDEKKVDGREMKKKLMEEKP